LVNNFSRRDEQGIPVLTAATCVLCGIIYLMLQSAHTWAESARWGLYPESAIYEGRFWVLITSAFVHVETMHLLFNLYWLWLLGGALERTIGPWKWLLFVFGTAFVSSGLQLATGADGIGLSGVGYALFGFGWVTRKRYPEFARIVDQQTVLLFAGWGLLCIVLTKLNMMHVANAAHAGGLMIGAAIGGLVEKPKLRIPLAFATLALLAGSIVPLYWNPLSPEWLEFKAQREIKAKNYAAAQGYLEQYYKRDDSTVGRKWCLYLLAEVYAERNDMDRYKKSIDELRTLDPAAADEVTQNYFEPAGEEPVKKGAKK
jgi:membrane associated rhomboid family serine protease